MTSSPRTHGLALASLTLASGVLYWLLSGYEAANGLRPVLGFLALMTALFGLYVLAARLMLGTGVDRSWAWAGLVGGSVAFRLLLIPAGLTPGIATSDVVDDLREDLGGQSVTFNRSLLYDHDIWRYLWDGHAGAHGFNPYRAAPDADGVSVLADPETAWDDTGRWVWTDIRANINHPSVPTLYPPLAQAVFRLSHAVAPGSVAALKLILVAIELVGLGFLVLTLRALGRDPLEAVWYAWNPLMIKVFAGSGHMDSVLMATVVATIYWVVRKRPVLASVSVALAVLAKLSPVVLIPLVLRRTGLRYAPLMVAVIAVGFLPFASIGTELFSGFRSFQANWAFNAGPFYVVEWVIGWFTEAPLRWTQGIMAIVTLLAIAGVYIVDRGDPAEFAGLAALAMGLLLILSPTVMPWYLSWVLPAAVIARQRVWLVFSFLVLLAFCVLIDERERPVIIMAEYTLLAAFALWNLLRLRRINTFTGTTHAG